MFSYLQGTGLWYEIGVRVAEEPILTHVVAVQELVVSQSQPNYLACQASAKAISGWSWLHIDSL